MRASKFLAVWATAGVAWCAGQAAAQVLSTHAATLHGYTAGSATRVQGAFPRVEQRGVHLDGGLRAGAAQPWASPANPAADSWNRSRDLSGIDLAAGAFSVTEIDLALPAQGAPWVVGRTYNARQWDGSAYVQSDGYQGKNWFQMSQPELRFYDGSGDSNDAVYIVYGADRYLVFTREGSGNVFKGRNGAGGLVQYVAGTPDTWVYHDQHGTRTTFFGGNTASNAADWQLWKIADPAGNTAYVGHATTASTAVSNGYYTDGRIKEAFDAQGRRYTYTYTSVDSVNRLTEVKAEVNSGSWTTVGKVEYGYYSSTDNTYGDGGSLKFVKITTPLTDSGVESVKTKYYRYWKGTYNASTNPGHPHAIQYVVDYEGFRRADWADSTFDNTPFTMSESLLKPYATAYFEYDSERRVSKTWNSGQCGCLGATNGVHELSYGSNGSFSDNTSAYDDAWKTRAVVWRPDGSYVTQYFDEAGQALSRVVTESNPAVGTPKRWSTIVERSKASAEPVDGVVKLKVEPLGVSSYTHSTGLFGRYATDGMFETRGLVATATADKGLLKERRVKPGDNPSSGTLIAETEYASVTKAVGGVNIERVDVSLQKQTFSSMTPQTTMARTWHTGDAALMPKVVTTTHPAVDIARNGSGGSTGAVRRAYMRADGTTAFSEDEVGSFSYTEYASGQLVAYIRDARTNDGSAFASGDDPASDFGISESGVGEHMVTTYSYDAQGRLVTSVLPDGRETRSYYGKLADGRLVTISIPRVTSGPTYHGPATYTVTNLAGKAEASGTIALSGGSTASALTAWINESSADPIAALTASGASLKRLSTSIYSDDGTMLEESRQYFLVPGSGAGSDGTNYDATVFGYDSMGRRWRVKGPSGTIERSVFDESGRLIERWVGTNDNGFTGGEGSGPANMVKVEALEYDDDGAVGGAGRVTKRTLYVQDDAIGKRETTYEYDYRGRLLVQTNPTAPHTMMAYDDAGHVIATGTYSVAPGSAGNPASIATDRLTLTKTEYDERGRPWKSTRHAIDGSGTDVDSVESFTWYDAAGRVIKTAGEAQTKTFYDRLGRVTHRFTLASTNDAAAGAAGTLADADDVSGDVVLEESQTVYEPLTGRSIASVRISRFHSDTGTLGALDTNADADALAWTAANLQGRAQITANWYDALGRLTTTASYGTNGGATFDRDGLSVPTPSDTVLVTTFGYDDTGSRRDVTDPRGITTRTLYDDAGRTIATVANYVEGTPSGSAGAADDNYTRFAYTDGLKTQHWVDLDGDGVQDADDQVTTYTYGVVKGASAGDSKFARGDLLWKVQYPDSSGGTDVVTNAYNALGELVWTKDQSGKITEHDYDGAGRNLHKRVTTLASGFDGTVRRISTTYDAYGRASLITQHDDAAVGSGAIVNEVKYTYDNWGNIASFAQDRDSAVGTGSNDYNLLYTYAKNAGGNMRSAVRRTEAKLRYAATDKATVTYEYGSASSIADNTSRVSRVKLGGVTVAAYEYLGESRVVGVDYPETELMSNQFGTTSGSYPDLDRFNRPIYSRWTIDAATDRDFYRVAVAWDRGSNVTSQTDEIWSTSGGTYTIDGLSRLTQAVSDAHGTEQWTLSRTGNWTRNKLDLNSDSDYVDSGEQDDTQTFNDANELLTRDTDSSGGVDATLAHDPVGNLTDDGNGLKYEYDAFGRLVRIKDSSSPYPVLSEYSYNGLGHRTGWRYDVNVSGAIDGSDPWYYFQYDEQWRMVATYRGSDTSPKEIFVNHAPGVVRRGGVGSAGGLASGLDSTILRDKDATTAWSAASDATLEERSYYVQNWRGDVVMLIDPYSSAYGRIRERYSYSPYGVPRFHVPCDVDGDGDADNADYTYWYYTMLTGPYDVRGDFNLDGQMDNTDDELAITVAVGDGLASGGRGVLSASDGAVRPVGNRKGYAGYEHDGVFSTLCHVRHRVLLTELGRWSRRDPLGYVDGMGLYEYVRSEPVGWVDPFGLRRGKRTHKLICSDRSDPFCSGGGGPTDNHDGPFVDVGGGGGGDGGGGGGGGGGGAGCNFELDAEARSLLDQANRYCAGSCSGSVLVTCSDSESCQNDPNLAGQTRRPRGSPCPTINICPGAIDPLKTLKHELVHASQLCYCDYFTSNISMTQRICMELRAYQVAEPGSGCERACRSVPIPEEECLSRCALISQSDACSPLGCWRLPGVE